MILDKIKKKHKKEAKLQNCSERKKKYPAHAAIIDDCLCQANFFLAGKIWNEPSLTEITKRNIIVQPPTIIVQKEKLKILEFIIIVIIIFLISRFQ